MAPPVRLARRRLIEGPPPAGVSAFEGVGVVLLDSDPLAPLDGSLGEASTATAIAGLGGAFYLDPELIAVAALGGQDPAAVAGRVAPVFCGAGNDALPIAVVRGHDLLDELEELMRGGAPLAHAETGDPYTRLTAPTVAASARLGADAVAAAIGNGGRLVVVGHASVESLVAGSAGVAFDSPAVGEAVKAFSCGCGPVEVEPSTATPQQPTSSTPVDIVYRDGFAATAVIATQGPQAVSETALDHLRAELTSDGLAEADVHLEGYAPAGEGLQAIVLACVTAPQADRAEQALMRLRAITAASAGGARLHDLCPAQAFPRYKVWPTSVPSDLVGWSVEVRETRGWTEA
ncbi:MAG: acyclic terpene utilization AtuA family protein [Planctomycetota bacterium]